MDGRVGWKGDTERRRHQGSRSEPTVSKLRGYSTAQVYDFLSGTDLGEVQVWNHFAVAKPPSGSAVVNCLSVWHGLL